MRQEDSRRKRFLEGLCPGDRGRGPRRDLVVCSEEPLPGCGSEKVCPGSSLQIYHTSEPLSTRRIAKSFAFTETQAEAIAYALYLAGFVRGEFGVFRAVEDRVVRDIIDCLYMKEILGKPVQDLEQEFLEKSLPQREGVIRFDMTLPAIKEAELVAAQCLEQIGKNLHINQDAIGQLQIAVIEACLNAIERSKGTDEQVHVSFAADGDRVEVSIESAGREFVAQATGEAIVERGHAKAHVKERGIKMMNRFADEVRFERTARGTKTVLVKNLSKSVGVQKEGIASHE